MTVLVVHAAATWVMVGLIWTVQVVHYPLFALVGRPQFPAYEAEHTRRMGYLVAGPWALEAVTGLLLLLAPPRDASRWWVVADLSALAVTIAVTLVASVPAHRRLGAAFDPRAHRALVLTNWIRTAAWTGCGAVVLVLVATSR